MKSIKKYESLPPDLKKKQDEAGESFSVGDMFFYGRDGDTISSSLAETKRHLTLIIV